MSGGPSWALMLLSRTPPWSARRSAGARPPPPCPCPRRTASMPRSSPALVHQGGGVDGDAPAHGPSGMAKGLPRVMGRRSPRGGPERPAEAVSTMRRSSVGGLACKALENGRVLRVHRDYGCALRRASSVRKPRLRRAIPCWQAQGRIRAGPLVGRHEPGAPVTPFITMSGPERRMTSTGSHARSLRLEACGGGPAGFATPTRPRRTPALSSTRPVFCRGEGDQHELVGLLRITSREDSPMEPVDPSTATRLFQDMTLLII
jgi:hypothetical protein